MFFRLVRIIPSHSCSRCSSWDDVCLVAWRERRMLKGWESLDNLEANIHCVRQKGDEIERKTPLVHYKKLNSERKKLELILINYLLTILNQECI